MNRYTGKAADLVDYLNNFKLGDAGARVLGTVDEAADLMGGQSFLVDSASLLPDSKVKNQLLKISGGAIGKNIGRAIPVLGAAQSVADVGDIVFGNESAGNKIMDGTAMAIGGTIGGVLGLGNPILAAAGASTGKFVSDGLQYLFGDKKTPEQRKMEEALAMLKGGYV